jgi:hypothetical protein
MCILVAGMVDVIFADVAQPDQARIVSINASHFLKNQGHFVISIKVCDCPIHCSFWMHTQLLSARSVHAVLNFGLITSRAEICGVVNRRWQVELGS